MMLRTRFDNEPERIKDVYEQIDAFLDELLTPTSTIEECMNEFGDLIKALTGIDDTGAHDPDISTIGRAAALRWLKAYKVIQ